MPTWLTNLGAAAAVIYVTILFLKELRSFGASRDEERNQFLTTLREEREAFTQAIVRLVGLAQSMVDRCQSGVPIGECITGADVLESARNHKGESS